MWLFCLATAWLVRHLVEDGWAGAQGRESPRVGRRRAQHELAQKHRADTGVPTVGQAVTGRVAARIAEPRERGAFRRFLAELWQDAWVDAADQHRARRARRTQPAEPTRAMASRLCAGGCGRWVSGEWTHCTACDHGTQTDDDEPADWWGEDPPPAPDDLSDITDDDYLDADLINEPAPNPAPEPPRKDTPMTAPTTINGDTVSPLENLGFATACLTLNAAILTELDTMANNLAAAGVGDSLIRTVRDVASAADQFATGAGGARSEYAAHVAVQADIAGDTELRNTVRGTYLDTANA